MERLIFLFCVLILSACQSSDRLESSDIRVASASMAPPPVIYQGEPTGGVWTNTTRPLIYVAYKRFLTPSEQVDENPFSYLHFNKPPTTPKLKKQYLKICEMYSETFSDHAEVVRYLNPRKEKTMPVFWFLKEELKTYDCDEMIKKYDYIRAKIHYPHKSKQTPSLVAHFDGYIVRMNLGDLDNPEDLDNAFSVWKDHVARYPVQNEELDVVTIVFSMKKVLGAFGDILTLSKS